VIHIGFIMITVHVSLHSDFFHATGQLEQGTSFQFRRLASSRLSFFFSPPLLKSMLLNCVIETHRNSTKIGSAQALKQVCHSEVS
jgi:hypothetical protein